MRYSLIRVYLQLSRLQLMNHSINFPLHIFIVLLEESELIQYLLLINTNMFYPIWWYYLLVSSGVERTKYFSLFSFISTSVLVSLLLNGNITPVLIYWKKLVGYGKSLYSNDITLCRPAAKWYAIYTSFYKNRKTICLWTFLWNSSIYYYIFNGK